MSKYEALMEWLLQAKSDVLGRQSVPLSLCLLQIPHALDWNRILVSAVTVRRLTNYLVHGATPPRYWLQCCMAFVSRGHESDWLLACTYFFRPACSNAIYFRTLTIAQDVWTGLLRRMTGWLVNNELEVCRKSRPYYNLRHFPSIYMNRLKKTINKVSTTLQNSNQTTSEHKWEASYVGHVRWFLPSQIPLTCHWFCSFYVWQKFWVRIIDTAQDGSCAVFVLILVRTWIVFLLYVSK
jgi:hypothetical protein